jgi:hypothetical protein
MGFASELCKKDIRPETFGLEMCNKVAPDKRKRVSKACDNCRKRKHKASPRKHLFYLSAFVHQRFTLVTTVKSPDPSCSSLTRFLKNVAFCLSLMGWLLLFLINAKLPQVSMTPMSPKQIFSWRIRTAGIHISWRVTHY